MAKSGGERLSDLVQNAKALKDIIQAALRGGWQAAALEAIKHYWPYILIIATVLLLLPVIIFCCLPSIMFGFNGSNDSEISLLNTQAETIKGYYEQYENYCTERVEKIKDIVINGNQVGDNTADQPSPESDITNYEVIIVGGPMEKNWFIALYSVQVGNDLRNMNEAGVKKFVEDSIPYAVTDKEPESEGVTNPSDENTAHEAPSDNQNSSSESSDSSSKQLTITYLSHEQLLTSFSESDRNWAELMYKTLSDNGTSSGSGTGELVSPFPNVDWHTILTSGYGYRTDPCTSDPNTQFHAGLDLGMPMGAEIHAAKSGTVSLVQYSNTGYGYHVIIDHGDGLQTLYGHCSVLLVTEGQEITQGQVIAKVGSTGDSTGPHCHFEVRVNGKDVDPTGYLS